jgi:hypothetical protein
MLDNLILLLTLLLMLLDMLLVQVALFFYNWPGSGTVVMDGCDTGIDGCCTGGGSAAGFLRIWFCRICSPIEL